ncbi:ribosomal protein S18 acetylase RimI-like enzyme [Paenarthrobacter nicotinovorans]|uniref:GNAT family N-acetyltransferase n=1 Tax=Micrococcaceae TaxID=1268 RepID=UPI00087719D1|nr:MULTISPECIES: GNAT family N-acetyltransferase [Micrococcaceae]MDR6439207.1 ribosomal protein S18 acetylase RimI-like enzyme [Paenarthrobacter nicotinovorans]SCZ65853.1 Acetyltransferase (GNAT) domain-containing protein [Arthrobacter sp. UNCCL28]
MPFNAASPAMPDADVTGLQWRPATEGDLDNWAGLIARTAAVEHPVWYEKRGDLAHVLESRKNPPETSTVLGLDTDGTARAYGRISKNPEGDKATGMACVDPEWQERGIGSAVLVWQEGQVRGRFADDQAAGHTAAPPRLRIQTEEKHEHQATLLMGHGYRAVRWFNEMHRPLSPGQPSAGLPVVPLGAGLELRTLDPVFFEPVRQAHNDAFRDHWGSEPRDEESWRFTIEEPTARHDLSAVVLDSATGEVAGYQLSSFDAASAADRGFTEGYTELLGVRRAYRGRGIAQALLADAMQRYTGAGMEVASLDVDSANPTGALELYLRMGYEPVNRSMTWEKML